MLQDPAVGGLLIVDSHLPCCVEVPQPGQQYASGLYAERYAPEAKNADGTLGTPPDPNAITANTLAVLGPHGKPEHAKHIHELTALGPHIEHIRLLWTERKRLYQ